MSRVGMAKLVAAVAALIGVGVLALPAFAAVVASVRVSGDPKVGATLTSEITLADPASKVQPTLRWQRCKQAKKGSCDPIAKPAERGASYTIRKEDAGYWIGLKVQAPVPTPVPTPDPTVVPPEPTVTPEPPVVPEPPAPVAAAAAAETETTWSNFIGPVPGPAPTPTPEPTVGPDPDPPHDPPPYDEDEDEDPPGFVQTGDPVPPVGAEPRAAGAPSLLRPYPVVRVKGTLAPGGARISLLRVRAPAGAAVDVRCGGPSCSLHRRATGSRRVRALERFLEAGTKITVRVSKRDKVGKWMRFVVREGRAPARRDACLNPGAKAPTRCPSA